MTDKTPGKSEFWIDPRDITPSPFNQKVAAPSTPLGQPDIWIDPKSIAPNPFNPRAVSIRTLEGQLVDDRPQSLFSNHLEMKAPTLEEWLEVMEKSPKGIDPVLIDFLRANPKYFDPAGYEDEAITPRKLNMLSESLQSANSSLTHVEKGKPWFVPPLVVEGVVGKEMTGALIAFAQELGLNVQRGTSRSVKPAIPSPDDLGPKL
jgi:hypothetical protein